MTCSYTELQGWQDGKVDGLSVQPWSVPVRCNAVAEKCVWFSEFRCNLSGSNAEMQEGISGQTGCVER